MELVDGKDYYELSCDNYAILLFTQANISAENGSMK